MNPHLLFQEGTKTSNLTFCLNWSLIQKSKFRFSSFVFYIHVNYLKRSHNQLFSHLVERAEQRYAESYQATETNDEKSRLCSVLQVGISLVVNIQRNKSRRIFDKNASSFSSPLINYNEETILMVSKLQIKIWAENEYYYHAVWICLKS